jgi:hypothetical protein
MKAKKLLVTGVLALSAAACAGAPAPTERLATTTASVRAAQEVGATHVPRAELHLRLAQEQIDKARRLMEDGENERADLLLKRAEADAELAVALAREETSRKAAMSAEQKVSSAASISPGAEAQANAVQ